MRAPIIFLPVLLSLLASPIAARRSLKASSLVPCMENSQLSATTFEVSFDPETKQLSYNLDLDSGINGYVTAKAEVYAYGFKVIEETINLCSLPFKQFCPLYSGEVMVDSIETISSKYANMIPGIAYTVPDIDGYVKVRVHDSNNGTELACMAAFFSNGKTVSHAGAKWATAVVAGLGLLVSAVLSAFGSSNAASHISVNALSLFTYFQSVVISSMLHVESMPPIASAWAENLAWSMGLIRITFMQKIFRWYIQATGGSPTLNFISSKKAILVQRSIEYLRKRAPALVVSSSDKLKVFRGIKRIGYNAHIENTSIVVTGFTFFVLCGYVLACFIILAKMFLEFLVKIHVIKSHSTALVFRSNWKTILKGALLRYIAIGFTQLTIFSLWEFTQRDSSAVITLAVLFLLLAIGITGWATYRAYYFGRQSVLKFKNPAAVLYGNQKVLDKYGFAYTMYNANKYWWAVVFLVYTFVKAVFVGLCQSSGKTQALVLFILDLFYLIAVIYFKPYLDKSTNILNIIISTVVCLNSFMFMFFSNLFNQNAAVSSIMGWVFFILNAAFSLILLVIIIVLVAIVMLSKVPDARFRKAGDDRTSFQRNSAMYADEKSIGGTSTGTGHGTRNSIYDAPNGTSGGAAELLDLGIVAKNHQSNWEDEIYRLQDMASSRGDVGLHYEDPLQLKSKDTIEKLRDGSSSSGLNSSGSATNLDDEPVRMMKPSTGTGAGAGAGAAAAAAALGSKLAHSLSLKKSSSVSKGQSGNALTKKLSAMKVTKNNNTNNGQSTFAEDTSRSGCPQNYDGNPYGNTTNAKSAQETRSSSANYPHQRTLSATPINSPNANEDFNFVNSDPYYNRYDPPTTTAAPVIDRQGSYHNNNINYDVYRNSMNGYDSNSYSGYNNNNGRTHNGGH